MLKLKCPSHTQGLVEVITSSDDHISVRATILLGQLLHMVLLSAPRPPMWLCFVVTIPGACGGVYPGGDYRVNFPLTVSLSPPPLSQANTILPHSHSHHLHCLPTLMNMAASFDISQEKRL